MWEFLKDVVAYLEWDTVDPLELSLRDSGAYLASKGISQDEQNAFRWIAPKNLWQKTEAPDASYQQHFEVNNLLRRKRAVVVKNSSREIDLVLCRSKKEGTK
ncbi:MAG: hypothetical protein V7741_10385 [Hyphomonas sp.]